MQGELTVRRARRDDFARVRALLGAPAGAQRADQKRFRRLVSTMREDLYVAERAGEDGLAGLVVIAYLRGLGPATAIVRDLRGDGEAVTRLLACARTHAAARGCTRLEVHQEQDTVAPDDATEWEDGGRIHRRPLGP